MRRLKRLFYAKNCYRYLSYKALQGIHKVRSIHKKGLV